MSTARYGDFYGSPKNRMVDSGESTKASGKTMGKAGREVMKDSQGIHGFTGLEMPALLALGIIAWWLFRVF